MLLAIDIGNTDFTIGIFQEKKLCDTFRMRTKINRTSDEYGVFILNTLQYKGYEAKDVEDVIISSVVPAVMHSFNSAIIKYFGLKPIIVGLESLYQESVLQQQIQKKQGRIELWML